MSSKHSQNKSLSAGGLSSASVQRIHVVCAQHLDVAWLWPRVPNGEDLMRQCFERVVEMIEKHPDEDFVFSRSTAWSYHIIEQQCPELFKKVKAYVKKGKIALCGGQWVEPDHLIPSGEALVRQAALGQWYFQEKFGKTARVCWALDNFAHAGSLPQILRKTGIDGYYLGRCLPADTKGNPRRQFIWKGIDGSDVVAFTLLNIDGDIDEASIRKVVQKLESEDLPAILTKANDVFSDRRVMMKSEWVPQPARIDANPDLPDCQWSSPDDIVEDIQSYREQLPVVEGELGFEHTGTYTTDGRYKRKNRQLETLLPNAEKASSWAALHGFPYPASQLKKAWSDLCLNQFHDLSCGSSFGEVLDEADRLNTEIDGRGCWALDQSLAFICDRLCAERQTDENSKHEIAVFSFLSFENLAPVLLPKPDANLSHYVDEAGNPVICQEIRRLDGSRFDLILHSSNGMDIRIYQRVPGEQSTPGSPIAKPYILENYFIRVDIDPETGDIIRFLDKRQETEFLPPDGRGNRLEFLEEANLCPHPSWCTMEPWRIMYTGKKLVPESRIKVSIREEGPLRGCIRVSRRMSLHRKMPDTVIDQDIILYRHSPLLHFETRGEWHAERVLLKTRFDLPFTATRVDADAPYGVAERRLPQHLDINQTIGIGEEWEDDKKPPPEPDRCMQTWLDVSDGRQGLLILNNGKYGYDADEKQVGISLMRAPNMRPWKGDITGLGPFEFSYAIMPHAGNWRTVDAPRHGQAFNNAPVARPVQSGIDDLAGCQWWDSREEAPLPIAKQLLFVRQPGAQVTALKRAEDGKGFILRLVEYLGEERKVSLTCCREIDSVTNCDLLEKPLPDPATTLSVNRAELKVGLSAYEIKTLRIRFKF
ncbi:alpha-mannosidase [Verrucomicrobiota bacterium]